MLASSFTVEIPVISTPEYFLKTIQKYDANRIALVDALTDRQYTYGDLVKNIKRTAAGLWQLGVRKGDMVAMFSPNTPEYVFMFFGVMCTGATLTTINPSYTVHEVRNQLKDSAATYVYTVPESSKVALEAVKQAGERIKAVVCVGDVASTVPFSKIISAPSSDFPQDVEICPQEDVAFVPYSSGTTGLPKGVMLTHYNIIANMLQISHPGILGDSRTKQQLVVMAYLPFFHVYGAIGIMSLELLIGSKLVILPRFAPEPFLSAIERYKVQFISVVPPVIVFMATSPLVSKYDLSSVQQFHSGAAPLARDTEEEFRKRLNYQNDLTQGFGMTETTVCATICPFGVPTRAGSSGVPVPNTEIQVVDPSSGAVLGPGERGELWVRGPQVMKGYLNRPEATQTTKDANGWLHTGDVVYYDDDGCVYIVDRIKELIKYKGFQVAPAELEALLLNHPLVADVGVIGVPDKEAGERPRAYVVKQPGTNLTAEDVFKYVAERTAKIKHLTGGVTFLSTIPKSPSGKILRRHLRDMAKNESAQSKL